MDTQRVEGHTPITKLPWQSYWRIDEDGHANCGIFSETIKGHAYSVCRAPKYQTKEQWEADSAFILHACNNIERLEKVNEALVRALKEIASCPEEDINEQTVHIMLSIARSALAKEPA